MHMLLETMICLLLKHWIIKLVKHELIQRYSKLLTLNQNHPNSTWEKLIQLYHKLIVSFWKQKDQIFKVNFIKNLLFNFGKKKKKNILTDIDSFLPFLNDGTQLAWAEIHGLTPSPSFYSVLTYTLLNILHLVLP